MLRLALLGLLTAAPLAVAQEARVYGAAMPPGAATPIAAALEAARAEPGAPAKFSGRITQVCQARGCWLMLEEQGRAARVMMKDHAFAVPKDARGSAVVYGTLAVETLDAAQAQHLAQDAGAAEPAPAREFRIVASSVALSDG